MVTTRERRWRRLRKRFDDANVALGGIAQHLQCGLIGGTIVRGDGFLHAVEFEHDDTLDYSLFVSFDGVARARKRPPAAIIAGPASLAYSARASGLEIER
jgi:hypothetical protein